MKKKIYKLTALILLLAMTGMLIGGCTSKDDPEPSASDTTNTDNTFSETVSENQVLLDEAGIKIVLNEMISDEDYGKAVVLSFENNTEKDLIYDCKTMIINGFVMIEDTFALGIAAGGTDQSTIYLDSTELQEYGIDKIGEVSFRFDFYTPETYDNYLTPDIISFHTSEYENMPVSLDFDSEVIYDDNDIVIKAIYVAESDIYKNVVVVYVENNTDTELMLISRNVRINDIDTGKHAVTTVLSKKAVLTHIVFTDEELENAGIEKVEDMAFAFEIYDRSDVSLITETEEMAVTVR